MNDQTKTQLLEQATTHVRRVQEQIQEEINIKKAHVDQTQYGIKPSSEFKAAAGEAHLHFQDISIKAMIHKMSSIKLEELEVILPSPYFTKCIVKFEKEAEPREMYFSKFSFNKANIYSWIAPSSALRFEDIGDFELTDLIGRKEKGKLLHKDQFMIVDGKIMFMTSESEAYPRTLIHQEHLSRQKKGFVMKDIVDQMEKAQDKVIRAHHQGSFLISGPAGSGKTTLALHRVAYLAQSPETANLYPSKEIIVFVQDESTQKYFGALLPELGITDVHITTFPQWANKILQLPEEYEYIRRFGETELEKDELEFHKKHAISQLDLETLSLNVNFTKPFDILKESYLPHFTKKTWNTFKTQQDTTQLDRFDLTALLLIYQKKHGTLNRYASSYEKIRGQNKMRLVYTPEPLKYSLIIMDEIQNYLPEQVELIKSCINPRNHAMLYVGDLAQQTQIGTLNDWSAVNENFLEERQVTLHKVYRNTQKILQYISTLGYKVEIPTQLPEGEEVNEMQISLDEQAKLIKEAIETKTPNESIGIICLTKKSKEDLKSVSKINVEKATNVYFMTVEEAQGVEFDKVFIAALSEEQLTVSESLTNEQQQEKKKVLKDLLYVGLTRAMNHLQVFSEKPLKELIQNLE